MAVTAAWRWGCGRDRGEVAGEIGVTAEVGDDRWGPPGPRVSECEGLWAVGWLVRVGWLAGLGFGPVELVRFFFVSFSFLFLFSVFYLILILFESFLFSKIFYK